MDIERSRVNWPVIVLGYVSPWVRNRTLCPAELSRNRGKTPRITAHLNPAQQFTTSTQRKAGAAGPLARTHFAPPFPSPWAIYAPSPASNPNPSSQATRFSRDSKHPHFSCLEPPKSLLCSTPWVMQHLPLVLLLPLPPSKRTLRLASPG